VSLELCPIGQPSGGEQTEQRNKVLSIYFQYCYDQVTEMMDEGVECESFDSVRMGS
jgi:hypothetical protein